jgi:hypothetical protein
VRSLSARRIAAGMSIASGRKSGRSVGSIAASQFGSSVPLTMRRFSTSSVVRRAVWAVTSAWRRVACSDRACTTSMGAIVPTSTRVWLSCTSLLARSSDRCATSTACVANT